MVKILKLKKRVLFLALSFSAIALAFLLLLKKGPLPSIKSEDLELTSQDRILILAPHPDDEVLGCGGIIQQAAKRGLPLKVVFLTYGDNNQWSFMVYRKRLIVMPRAVRAMGLVRYGEAQAAAKTLGISSDQLIFLGYPDFRTLAIWYAHWGDRPAAKSMLTEVRAVPYQNAFRPGAPYKADEILKDLKTIIREFKPTRIFLSHPADHNPDHRSLYLFTRVALWDLEEELKPEIYPYLTHFKKWPLPPGYHPEHYLKPPPLLTRKIAWKILPLEDREVTTNHEAIKKHASQFRSHPKYLLSFIRANESFGDFPPVSLKASKSAVLLASDRDEHLKELPEELLSEERARFVGVEKKLLRLEDDSLVFTLKLSRPLGKRTGISIYLFGYRKDAPFNNMPKIHIQFGMLKHRIFDQNRRLPLEAIKVERQPKEITLRVPLEILGSPDRILTSARTYTGPVPLDWVAWRVLELSN